MDLERRPNHMKEVTRYQCEFCNKDFRTPDKHYCKKKPELKNCFTCKHLKGWLESTEGTDVGVGIIPDPNYPDCTADVDGWNIEDIKYANYNMQCSKWEQGTYDWRKDFNEYEGMEGMW